MPGKSYGQRSLAGYSSYGHKESDSAECAHTHTHTHTHTQIHTHIYIKDKIQGARREARNQLKVYFNNQGKRHWYLGPEYRSRNGKMI